MPRLFFALRTSEEQRTELRRVQKEIAGRLDDLHANYKLENIQNSHCTLRFLGNVDSPVVKPLIEAARLEIEKVHVEPFELTLDQCGIFSHRGNAKVIWCGLERNSELLALREAIDRAVLQCSIEIQSSEAFHPHLTLVRFREPFRLPADFQLPKVAVVSSRVSEVELIESKTLPAGAIHEVIAHFAL